MTPIRRLLIANRGEIAVRIARAARDLGIVPLGVYSDADREALHVTAMDEAVRIGPAEAAASYLDVDRILAAAHDLGADAVHPGYGFLSERAVFARAVRDAGLVFVGPTPEAIAAMGDKVEAKRRVRAHGVPVVPGYDGDDVALERLRAEAARIGTPVLIKASAGGGGRGMRVVENLAAFDEALEAAQREAKAAFGDDRVLLERYVARPRHIEFQILADAHGNTIHLGERECSIQRRHQKILEEAPSSALAPELRARMGEAAIRAARAVDYTNAGTVEFLLDQEGAFYFLEMNARLQVEHPVTEAVHGLDLVGWQLRIAAGERLTIVQPDVVARGWAIEARLNAEDPRREYLPSSGTISAWEAPDAPGIRVDAGIRTGSEISIYYDSMLAKIIAWGADRAGAVARLGNALDATRVEGVATNLPLLARIVREPDFQAGATTTAYLNEHAALLDPGGSGDSDAAFVLGIVATLGDARSWRIGGVGIPIVLCDRERTLSVLASRTGSDEAWALSGDLHGELTFERRAERAVALFNGARYAGSARSSETGVEVEAGGTRTQLTFAEPPRLGTTGSGHGPARRGKIVAPMPGKIAKVLVRTEQAVGERDLLLILEAMKMEHRIEAPLAGTVRKILVEPGALVAAGAELLEIE
ncbi:MAG: acetyl-CoA carboxylase biotin carboxylase subunit [Candidatus Baltobacteraceae bacterium]